MSGYMINWITMTLVFLLPLIPAFLLYRFLSAQAEMGGKLFGIPIKLGGSIAGYVALLLIAVNLNDQLSMRAQYQRIALTGSVKLDGLGADDVDNRLLNIAYLPRQEAISAPYDDGVVDWKTVVVQPIQQQGEADRVVADILISYSGFKTQKLTLSSASAAGDDMLSFGQIVLHKKPDSVSTANGGRNVFVLNEP